MTDELKSRPSRLLFTVRRAKEKLEAGVRRGEIRPRDEFNQLIEASDEIDFFFDETKK